MPDLLLPGTRRFRRAGKLVSHLYGPNFRHGMEALDTIKAFWQALHTLHTANAEGQLRCVQAWSTCPTCPMVVAWQSEELKEIRRAIEEETCAR